MVPTSPTQSIAPLMQRLTPAVHSPVFVPQTAPPSGSPSSVTPLQLLSLRSHISADGALLQTTVPVGLHCLMPPAHSPMPELIAGAEEHASPIVGSEPSSVLPSQSSSMLLQTSATGFVHGGASGASPSGASTASPSPPSFESPLPPSP